MSWAATATAAGGVAGALLNDGGEKMHPMEYIPEHLRQSYKNLSSKIEGMPVPEYYQGQLIADQSQWTQDALNQMGSWGAGQGGDIMNQVLNTGQGFLDAGQQGVNYLNMMQERGPNQFQYDQGTYDQSMNNLTAGLQNVFDFGAGQIQQNFDWNVLPGLDMAGALGGQSGSTKQFQQGALGQALANQNIQDFGTGLWTNAANRADANAMSAGGQNLSAANNFDTTMLSNYGRMGEMGSRMLSQGYDMGLSNMGLGLEAGKIQDLYNQSIINADKAKWDFEQNAPMAHLTSQLGLIPGPGQPVQASGPSNWEAAIQGAQAGLGIWGMGQDAGWWGSNSGGYGHRPADPDDYIYTGS